MRSTARGKIMTTSNWAEKPVAARFVDAASGVLLELTNTTNQPLKSVEVLTVFLKDEETPGGPSRAHIRFEAVKNLPPGGKAVLSHKTLVDGKTAAPAEDQLERLKVIAGEIKPYVLDISWEDADGKSQYLRIPVGH